MRLTLFNNKIFRLSVKFISCLILFSIVYYVATFQQRLNKHFQIGDTLFSVSETGNSLSSEIISDGLRKSLSDYGIDSKEWAVKYIQLKDLSTHGEIYDFEKTPGNGMLIVLTNTTLNSEEGPIVNGKRTVLYCYVRLLNRSTLKYHLSWPK